MPRSRRPAPAYYALVVPGIEDLAADELRRLGATVGQTLSRFDKRDSLIAFTTDAPERLRKATLIEDIFAVLLDAPTPPARTGPKQLAAKLDRAALERAMLTHHALQPRHRGRSFGVVARMAGRQQFRREEIAAPFVKAIGAMLPHWVATNDSPALEVWVQVIGERTLAALRLTDDSLAQRGYKRAHLPASLKPTVARALTLLADAGRGAIVVDPMCGAGTVLRERADSGSARLILGGDIDAQALDAAHQNCGRSAALARWEAMRLPLRDASVDAVITNPPYGRQHEAVSGLDRLYARSMREAARVLRDGGRCVVLTGEADAFLRAIPPTLAVQAKRRILLRGLPVLAITMVRAPRS